MQGERLCLHLPAAWIGWDRSPGEASGSASPLSSNNQDPRGGEGGHKTQATALLAPAETPTDSQILWLGRYASTHQQAC